MSRKRSAANDYICRRCECPCTPPLTDGSPAPFGKHLGGGQNRRSCGRDPRPVLRSDYEAEMEAFAAAAREAIRRRA